MRTIVGAFAILALAGATLAKDEAVVLTDELRALMAELMLNTKVGAEAADEASAETYRPDADPMTLQLVMLPAQSSAPSRVVHDGEVIILNPNAGDDERKKLFTTAFYLKAQRKLSGSNPPSRKTAPPSGIR